MNKKVIFIGTIVVALACLFPPFGSYFHGTFVMFGGWHFFTYTGVSDGAYEIATFVAHRVEFPYLMTEILGIVIVTLGLAYTLNRKHEK